MVVLVCPLVVLICPPVVSVYPLVVLVVLYVGLFITDREIPVFEFFLIKLRTFRSGTFLKRDSNVSVFL